MRKCDECGVSISFNQNLCIDCHEISLNASTTEERFTKQDEGKPMVSLVEPRFILGMAEVLTFGAEKYAIDGWKAAGEPDIRRLKDSLLRHVLAYTGGELVDPESGTSHALHAAANMMFLHYFETHPPQEKPND